MYTASKLIWCHTKVVLLRLEAEAAKSLNDGSNYHLCNTIQLTAFTKTLTSNLGKGGNCWEVGSSGERVMYSESSVGACASCISMYVF